MARAPLRTERIGAMAILTFFGDCGLSLMKGLQSGCGRRERSQLFGGFCGKRYSWDCTWLRGCCLVHSKPASTLEPDRNQARVCGMVPPRPCRCRRTADCNGKEYLL